MSHGALLEVSALVPSHGSDPCLGTEPRFEGRPASLTDALGRNGGFLDALMPGSRHAIGAINRALRLLDHVAPSPTTTRDRLHARVASAVDRGALYLYGADIQSEAIAHAERDRHTGARIAAALKVYRPPRKAVFRNRTAIGWFYLLGAMEPIRRGYREWTDVDVRELPTRLSQATVETWLASLVAEDVHREVVDLLRAVRDSRIQGAFRANPVFGGLGSVTGSDGDWICGDTLVELKCTVRGVQRQHVAQLLCYHVFDRLERPGRSRYGIRRLALCLPRQRCTIQGDVADWLVAFGCGSSRAVEQLVRRWCDASSELDVI